ncbi:hypothetical protein CSOJ01_02559 [Colletotrichum sojae]|uniref:Uncharacterized protein n=1 Tax=Colletotrichum sojae TaxID=2175907 RepID=A0A8H6JPU2_9PEZI|nr:hypothetical protein CSOJ01_02559 [Colletotrichum sojae]
MTQVGCKLQRETLSDLGRCPSVPGRAKVNPATDRDDLLLLMPETLELRETRSDVDVDISTSRWLNLASRNGLVRGGLAFAQGESPALDGYYSGGASSSSTGQDKAPPPPKARRSESKGQPPALGAGPEGDHRAEAKRSRNLQSPVFNRDGDTQPATASPTAKKWGRLATSVCSSFAVAEGALEGGGNGMAWHCLQEGEEMCPRNLADSTRRPPSQRLSVSGGVCAFGTHATKRPSLATTAAKDRISKRDTDILVESRVGAQCTRHGWENPRAAVCQVAAIIPTEVISHVLATWSSPDDPKIRHVVV